ncbi:uncharacterized protein C1orf158 homolog [Pteropus vampyrus]|uniref:Uncharacterized protein C1orf158 homolog n=1 Tax=Pteropus vampyrus TaxID=132908 RepID=A0A6P3QEY0_PTEVA|nr:uncharacterized protein C1orf158 homolog [Pteropus vampyrus]
MQFLTAVSPQSFYTPSWKTEAKYSTRVLTGNWVEERRKFTKATEKTPQCIHRKDYVPFPGHRPDQISRWYGKRRIEFPLGNTEGSLVNTLPVWGLRIAFAFIDLFGRAPPTNYGLYEQLKQRWLAGKAGLRESVYASSYPRPPLCALSPREHAIPVPPPRLRPVPHF